MSINRRVYRALSFMVIFSFFLAGQLYAAEHKVSMKDWLFNPKALTVDVGDVVSWVNEDDTMHNIYFEGNLPEAPQKDRPEKIRIGKEFSLKFEKAGEYNYFCKNHLDYDMVGKVVVKGK
ncbi:MAG: plastocyanin/azurin family copper-binding protein [bacterium]|nr:plastocyanin/azurin family copper-binding protein [bacterium]